MHTFNRPFQLFRYEIPPASPLFFGIKLLVGRRALHFALNVTREDEDGQVVAQQMPRQLSAPLLFRLQRPVLPAHHVQFLRLAALQERQTPWRICGV